MTDEAAESRGPATTGAGSSQDAPAPSAAPRSSAAPDSPGAADPAAPAAPAALGDEPTAQLGDEPTAQAGDQPTAQAGDQPTAQAGDEPTVSVPQAWTPPAADAPPAADPPPPPPGPSAPPSPDSSNPPDSSAPQDSSTPPPGAGGPPPAAPPPWFGEGGPTFSRERLVRPANGRYIAGVCAALGRATNTDPVLWRVLLVVLGLFGGVGVLIYLIGWLGIRAEGDAVSPIESLLGRGRSAMAPFSVVLLGVAAVLTFAFIVQDSFRAVLLGGAVLAGIALLIKRNSGAGRPAPDPGADPATAGSTGSGAAFPFAPMDRTAAFAATGAPAATPAAAPAAGGPAATTAPAGEPVTAPLPPLPPRPPGYEPPRFAPPPAGDYRPPFAPHGPYAGGHVSGPPAPQPRPPKPPKPPRERSKLGRITFFAVLMVLGVLALLDVAAIGVPVSGYFAAALATIGLGLLVGAWFGRARGLIALALLTTVGLVVSSGVERFGGQVAVSNYRPQNISQVADRYDVEFGNVTIDLRAVDFTNTPQETTVSMNVGQVKVLLPHNVDTTAAVELDNGRAMIFGHEYQGENVNPINVTDPGEAGGGTLKLTIQMKAGNVEVVR